MSGEHENGSPSAGGQDAPPAVEHLNIKVTDNNNEVFFKIKRSTKLDKLMTAFCERQGKAMNSVRFLFEGQRVQPTDTPDTVSVGDAAASDIVCNTDASGTISSRWRMETLSRCTRSRLAVPCSQMEARITGKYMVGVVEGAMDFLLLEKASAVANGVHGCNGFS